MEVGLHVGQQHAVLRALGAGERGLHVAHVEVQHGAVLGFGVRAPQALRLGVSLHQRDQAGIAAGQAQVVQRFVVDREDAAGRAVFRRHVGDRRAIRQRQVLEAGAEEFDELADHAMLAQHLRHGQYEVGRGGAFRQLAGQAEADDLRNQHGARLAEHGGFGFDAADAPAQHADAVDHGGVRVGAEDGVREGVVHAVDFAFHHDAREVLQVDLVHDAGVRRHDLEVVEGLLAPAQEAVALAVAGELDLAVLVERAGLAEDVDLHRVVDHQFGRNQRIDVLRVAAELDHGIAHRREVDHAGHAGEVLQHHARRHEGDFGVRFLLRVPVRHCLDRFLGDRDAVLAAQQVLEQDLHREGQAGEVVALAELGEAVDGVGLAVDDQLVAGGEGVGHEGLRWVAAA